MVVTIFKMDRFFFGRQIVLQQNLIIEHKFPWDDIVQLLYQLSIKSSFEKAKLRRVPVTGSHIQKFDILIKSSGYAILLPSV